MSEGLLEDEGKKPSYIIDEYSINGNYRPLEDINNIKDKAVCLIKYNNTDGTGFFCEIPDPDEPQKKIIVLFTCYHVLKEIKTIKKIKYIIKNENEKELDLTKRKKWYHKGLDYVCIKIEEEDNISIFVKVDEEINDMNYKQYLKNLGINSLGYISSKLMYNMGNIKEIGKNNIYYDYSTKSGWSGGPIFNTNNNLVIGIHEGYDKSEDLNLGISMKSILNHIQNKGIDMSIEKSEQIRKKWKQIKKNKTLKIAFIAFIIFILIVCIISVICSFVFANKNKKKDAELKKEKSSDEKFIDRKNHKENYDSDILEYLIEADGKYRICVSGGNAKKGGKGCVKCAESYFKAGSIIEYKLGGTTSGGQGGKKCGWFGGNASNGAGLSWAKYSDYFYIVAGGGGGNSQSGNKGGNCEEDGKGNFPGEGGTDYKYGKGGNSPKGDGRKNKGGNGGQSDSRNKYCGGGGGDGYYGGGGGDFGNQANSGGGGGGSSFCQKSKQVSCLMTNINYLDCSYLEIVKKIKY